MKKHLLEAAERGDAEAQFNLGVIYENGLNDSRYAAEGNRCGDIYADEPDMWSTHPSSCRL